MQSIAWGCNALRCRPALPVGGMMGGRDAEHRLGEQRPALPIRWEPGEILHVYELVAPLAGTGGQFWRARHRLNHSSVIIKRLEPAEYEAIWRIAKARLGSPRLVTFLDLWGDFLVLEDGGETLAMRLGMGIAEAERPAVVREMFAGLADLHKAGIVHGRLHPTTIFLARNDRAEIVGPIRVRLADYGVTTTADAKRRLENQHAALQAVEAEAARGDGAAPAGFADPALLDDRPLSARSDVFSAGLIAFEILFGRPVTVGDQLPLWLQRCLGPWANRYPDASVVVDALRVEFVSPEELARLSPTFASDSPAERLLRERLFAVVDEFIGKPPLNGAAFIELFSRLQIEGTVRDGVSRDRVRLILSQEIDRWNMAAARASAGLVKSSPATNTASTAADAATNANPNPDAATTALEPSAKSAPEPLREVAQLDGHRDGVMAVRLLRDGLWAVTGSADRKLKAWRLSLAESGWTARAIEFPRPHWDWVRQLAISPDGRWVLSASADRSARLWRLHPTSEQITEAGTLSEHDESVNAVAFAPTGTWGLTASTDGTAMLWHFKLGLTTAEIRRVATLNGHRGSVNAVAFAPSGKWGLTGGDDGTAIVWRFTRPNSTAPGKTQSPATSANAPPPIRASDIGVLAGHRGSVFAVAFAPDGRLVVTAGADGIIRLWTLLLDKDSCDRHLIVELQGHTHPITAVAFSPDGTRLATGSLDGTAKIWCTDLATTPPVLLHALTPDNARAVRDVAFSADGRWLALAIDPGPVRIYQLPPA